MIAQECRNLFVGGDPAVFLQNGLRVSRNANNEGAFAGIFRRGATGVLFSQGTLEYTLPTDGSPASSGHVIGFKTRSTMGAESFEVTVTVEDGNGKLLLVGNQCRLPGAVTAFHQKREFITLGQDAYDYFSTGCSLSVPNWSVPGTGSGSGTNFIRLRSKFVTPQAGLLPRNKESAQVCFAQTEWTESELAAAPALGS